MVFGKWNFSGELTWTGGSPGEILYATPDLNDSIAGVAPPIGTILGVALDLTGVPSLPSQGCWVLCDGSTISDSNSPLDGQFLPDLNGQNRFLRGNVSSGGIGGNASHFHSHTVGADVSIFATTGPSPAISAIGHVHTVSNVNKEPPYYGVVFVMRIK